jgi:hypothetical protein
MHLCTKTPKCEVNCSELASNGVEGVHMWLRVWGGEEFGVQHRRRGASAAKNDPARPPPRRPPNRNATSELRDRCSHPTTRIYNTFRRGGESQRTKHGECDVTHCCPRDDVATRVGLHQQFHQGDIDSSNTSTKQNYANKTSHM